MSEAGMVHKKSDKNSIETAVDESKGQRSEKLPSITKVL
jgi:hypothetical protein